MKINLSIPLQIILFVLGFQNTSSAQSATACCKRQSTADFALLGSNELFKAAHQAPMPFSFIPLKGEMISVPGPDGREARAFEIKADKQTNNYLFVFQEWWGLNDYIKQEAQNLSEELGTVNVLAIDLYDGRIAANADEAGKIMNETKEERVRAIIGAFIKYAGYDAKIQTIGWCYGGGWSLQASIMAGKNATGCVMYYGATESNRDRLKSLNAPVLAIFASRDGWINAEMVGKFEKDMHELGKTITVKTYEADHAFANPSNPNFQKEATEDAHMRAVKFLRDHLQN